MEIDVLKSLIFYGFSGALIVFALFSLFSNRILYSLLSAICVFLTAAGLFYLLGAEYNAVIQIALYGVAIPILFVLAIMFTADSQDKKIYLTVQPRLFFSFLGLGVLFLSLVYLMATALSLNSSSAWIMQKQTMSINKYQMFSSLSNLLFGDYVVAFELFSILLLVVVVGISTLNLIKEKPNE